MRPLLLLVALSVGWPGSARAEPAPRLPDGIRIAWLAPAGCPGHSVVVAEAARLLGLSTSGTGGMPPFSGSLEVQAHVVQREGAFELSLSLRDGDAERKRDMKAPTCMELARATALVVALAVKPSLADEHAPDAGGLSALEILPCPEPEKLSPPSRPACPRCAECPPPPAALVPAENSTRSRGLFLGAGTQLALGALPEPRPRALLTAGVDLGSVSVDLALTASAGKKGPDAASRGAAFELFAASPRVCRALFASDFELGACLGTELGVLRGVGFGVDNPQHQSSLWVAPSLGLTFDLRLARSGRASLTTELLVPIVRTRFDLAGQAFYEAGATIPAVRLSVLLDVLDR